MPYKVIVAESDPDLPERCIFRSGRKFSSKKHTYLHNDEVTHDIIRDPSLIVTWVDEAEYEQCLREARKTKS